MHKKIDKRMIVPFCVCVLLLAVVAGAIVWSWFTDIETVAERYAVGMIQNDADAIYAMYTPAAIDYLMRETDMTADEIKGNLRYKMSLWQKRELTQEIGRVSSANAHLIDKQDVAQETVEELEANFGVRAQGAKCLTLSYHASGEKGEKDGEMTAYIVKIDGKWYLYDLQMLLG